MTMRALGFGILVGLLLFCQSVWADSYPDILYKGGHPEFGEQHRKGTLTVLSDRILFFDKAGKGFMLPFLSLTGLTSEIKDKEPQKLKLWLAGPNPIALAAGLGATVIDNTARRMMNRGKYEYTLHFKDAGGNPQTLLLKMPDDDILAQVSALLETNIQTYKEELRRTASQGSALRQ